MPATMPRLREKYEAEISKELGEKFQYKSSMQVPRPVKVVINMGLGKAPTNAKLLENALDRVEAMRDELGPDDFLFA